MIKFFCSNCFSKNPSISYSQTTTSRPRLDSLPIISQGYLPNTPSSSFNDSPPPTKEIAISKERKGWICSKKVDSSMFTKMKGYIVEGKAKEFFDKVIWIPLVRKTGCGSKSGSWIKSSIMNKTHTICDPSKNYFV